MVNTNRVKYIFIEKKSLTEIIIGNTLWISGVLAFIFVNIKFGVAYIFLWIFFIMFGFFLLSSKGIEFNFKTRHYKKFEYILWSKIGLWEYIPKADYISIFRTTINQTIKGLGFSSFTARASEKTILVNLLFENRKVKTLYKTKNKVTALEIAKLFKENFNLKISNKLE